MLDLARLQAIHLRQRPPMQVFMANVFMRPQYARVDIVFEGYENVPQDRSVFFAMNHTDRFTCWPMQYTMLRRGERCTATWVKGKYYARPLMAWFLDAANNIPLPSRGYVLTTVFQLGAGRVPNEEEYRLLRAVTEAGAAERAEPADEAAARVRKALARGLVGRDDLSAADVREAFRVHFERMMSEVVRINAEALERNLNIVVFPEGTRTKRLGKGLTGLAQITQHLGVTIVPVGASGGDKLYPGNSALAKPGRIVYRFGAPLDVDGPALGPHRVRAPFVPFTDEAAAAHAQPFAAITGVVMERLAGLVDDEYKPRAGDAEASEKGMRRFV